MTVSLTGYWGRLATRSIQRNCDYLTMHDKKRGPTNVFRFVGKVLAIIAVVIAAFWVIGYLFAFSKWAGFSSLGVVLIALYATAHRWIPWLPGVLVFGVINSLL